MLRLFLVVPLRTLRLPSGSIALMMLYEALLIVSATAQWMTLLSVISAALVGEMVWGWMQRGGLGGVEGTVGYWVLGGVTPLVLSAVDLGLVGLSGRGIAWSVHLLTGVPVTAGILGLTVAVIAVPPAYFRALTPER